MTESSNVLLSAQEAQHVAQRLILNVTGAAILAVGIGLDWFRPEQQTIAELIQALAAALVGVGTLRRGLKGLTQNEASAYSDQLVAIAVIAAAVSGDFVTAALVPLVLDIGRIFEERSTLGAQAAIEQMLSLQAKECLKVVESNIQTCPIEALQPGDVIRIRVGEIIPADGQITKGNSQLDTSSFSGEALPQSVKVGDVVYAGMVNLGAQIDVRITEIGDSAELGKIIALLREAEQVKLPVQKNIERVLAYYLPIGLCLAASVLYWTEDLSRSVAILVALCPTALALAGPSVMIAALTAAARRGCVVKAGAFFESLATVDVLAIDKTGTLTEGKPRLTAVHSFQNHNEQEVLAIASALSQGSLHPIAQVLSREAPEPIHAVEGWKEVIGSGIIGSIKGVEYQLGRLDWLVSENTEVEHENRSGTWLASGGTLLGFLAVEDDLEPFAQECLNQLRQEGIGRCVMLTGDKSQEAERIGKILSMDSIHAGLLPIQKLDLITLEQQKHSVLMVGDGINDALALQAAHVGVAVGEQLSAAALGGADAVLFSKDLSVIVALYQISKKVMRHILQNVGLGLLSAILLFSLAAMGVLSPVAIAVVHSFGVLLVLLNAGRLIGTVQVSSSPSEEF
ncbi:MAG: cation-translocating P-type ATPase [Myxococcota bacterium]|nr:cation-translocating P-type ATPase [Myxococcota bacterium]